MLRDPDRGISAGICHVCGEEVPYIATFCPVCGQQFVQPQLMPDVQTWVIMSQAEQREAYDQALRGTLEDIRFQGDWRIGCINKGETKLSDLITKPTIKTHIVQRSHRFPGDRPAELERIARAHISQIKYDRSYEEYEPVFELFRRLIVSSSVEPAPDLVSGLRTLSGELTEYIQRHPDALYRIDPKVFEQLVAEILSDYGFDVQLNVRTASGEVDIVAVAHDSLGKRTGYLVECKRYAIDRKVSIGQVARLYELKRANEESLRLPYAMFVTTSDFTSDTVNYYGNRWDLDLKNCEALLEWLWTHGSRDSKTTD